MTLLFAFLAALLLGMRHASDPDHVLAVTTIVTRERSLRRASLLGALWGLGHTVTVLAVGGAIILLKLSISPRVGLSMEMLVAVMLIALGLMNIFGKAESHRHPSAARPVAVGVIHGLAGSAAVTLLVVPLIGEPWVAVVYLIVFGLGTILGMVIITAVIAAPAAFVARRSANVQRSLRFAAGCASLIFGLYLSHRIGVVDGLFKSQPSWTPH